MSKENKEKYLKRYKNRGCTIAQLKRLVELGALTKEEYKEIVGEEYLGGE